MAQQEEQDAERLSGLLFEEVVAATTILPLFLEIREVAVQLWRVHRRIKPLLREKRVWTALCLRHWPSLASDSSFNSLYQRKLFRTRFEKSKREELERRRNERRHRGHDMRHDDDGRPGMPPTQGLIIQIQ
mmetsp:Transcript_12925/g.29174  ORF Transcript_12925/g.29174 Transcript_12925/m.29174 type:complete len:131 (+) Transcript_12925:74-466(+)